MTDIQKPDAPDEDIDARIACVLAEYEAQDRRSLALFPANKAALFDALGGASVTTVAVTFDGYGDSGQIEEITAQQGDRVFCHLERGRGVHDGYGDRGRHRTALL